MKTKIILLISIHLCFLISKAQTVTTVTEGLFHDGLAVDDSGNVYGSDYTGDSVYKYDTNGNVTVFKDGFVTPNGIGIDPAGAIYICDHEDDRIFKYSDDGTLLNTYNGLESPAGIKNIPGTNDMLIVEYNTSSIKLLDGVSDTISELMSLPVQTGPAGIAFVNGEIYIGGYNNRKIYKLINNTTFEEIAQLPANATQGNVLGFLTSYNGYLYATQIGEGRIYKINPSDGDVTIFAGSVLGNMDGSLANATFNLPNGIIADEANNRIYVSDAGTKNLRIIDEVNLGLGDTSLKNFKLQVYPNPTDTNVILKGNLDHASSYIISVYSNTGKKIANIERNKMIDIYEEINVSKWASGMYVFEIQIENQKQAIRFLKK